jgi:hypothetical protein
MKLKKIMEQDTDATVAIIGLFDRLSKTSSYRQAIAPIVNPTDKYKAIVKFASTLGIPESKFMDFVQNMQNIKQNGETQ